MAGEVLDEEPDETFHGSERGAVDHDRAMGGVVGTDVAEVEALGEIVVDLDGAELPFAADDVFDDEVDLRAVERGFAWFLGVVDPEDLDGLTEGGFGFVPVGGVADVFVGLVSPERKADAVVLHAEGVEDGFDEAEAALEFVGDLFLGAEEVGVVLGKSADAGHDSKRTPYLPKGWFAKIARPNW